MGITKVRLTKEEIIAAVRSENYGDSDLSSFASLSGSGLIERKSEGVIEAVPVTDYIKTLLNDASSAEVRTTLGLGSIATASTSSYLPITGGTLTGALIATSFSGVGTALTALNASNISTGTLNAARLPASYLPLTGGTITGDLISTSATVSTSPTTGAICGASLGISGAIFAGTLNGNGSGLTTLNASNLSSGTIPDARLTGAYTGITNLTGSGTATFGAFSGSGASLTALNASNISTGTINAARLPASYLPLTGGTITGDLVSTSATVSTSPTTGAIRGASLGVTGDVNAYTVSASELTVSSIYPGIWLNESKALTNKKLWYLVVDKETLQFQTRDDNGNFLGGPLSVSRAGTITTTDMIVSATTPSTSPTTGASRVTGGQGVQGNQHIGGFTSLGGDASHPGVKMKVLTGTTAATQGGSVFVAHGVNPSKIISLITLVSWSTNSYIPPSHNLNPGYFFEVYSNPTQIAIHNSATNSANILSKPLTITIIYTA
jgi:hypothetical protein